MAAQVHFRSFAEELRASSAGFFDGESAWVKSEHVRSPVVAVHEGQHEWIMMRTPDGTIVRLARVLSRNKDPLVRDKASSFLNEVVENTRHPHEVCATYLGLKFLFPAQIPEALNELPPEYLNYYNTLASVLDVHTSCTFLQYSLAVGITYFIFSSTALEQLKVTPSLTFPSREAAAAPCTRLRWALQWLEKDGSVNLLLLLAACEKAAEQAQRANGEEPWRINVEESWSGPARIAKTMVEKAIIDATCNALTAASPEATLTGEQLAACAARLREDFLHLRIDLSPFTEEGDTLGIDLAEVCDAFSSGDSRLDNVPPADSSVIHPDLFLRGIRADAKLRWIALRRDSADRAAQMPDRPWKLLPASLGSELTYDYCSYSTDAQLAALLADIGEDKFSNALPIALVIKREQNAGPALTSLLGVYFAMRSAGDYPQGWAAPWQYVERGWAQFLLDQAARVRAGEPKLILGRVVLASRRVAGSVAPAGMIMCYATNEAHTMYACKILSVYSAVGVTLLEDKLVEVGLARRLTLDDLKGEREFAGASCANLIGTQAFHAFVTL